MNNNTRDRQGARRGEGNNPEAEDESPSWWSIGLGVAAGVATVAGGIYMLNKMEEALQEKWQQQAIQESHSDHSVQPSQSRQLTFPGNSHEEVSSNNEVTMENILDSVSQRAVSSTPSINDLNSLLNDIHIRYIAIKKEDFARRYEVLTKVFNKLQGSMKAVDSYYERYSSRLIFRPEEFKMYIVIRLPVNIHEHYRDPAESDIVIEPQHASFVQLHAGIQYQNLLFRDGTDCLINRTAYQWLDDRNYILRSKFVSWFQSVLDRALNKLQRSVRIDGIEYKITTSIKEGAYTLWITSATGFRFDVNLVPSLKFPEERWLGRSKGYREIPSGCNVDYWMVVPKPNKFSDNSFDVDRSWHLDLHEQEKKFIHNSFHLRQAMRLLKKLRDAQQMTHIENYHIETFFMWKCEAFQKSFWQLDVATVFKVMLQEFSEALENRQISFFWKKSHNLIENIPMDILKGYARKLDTLHRELESDHDYMAAAEYILTDWEYTEYKDLTCNRSYAYYR